ncbi:MAG: lactate racemase domain-containing protein [Planctomycetota bacterium]
MPVLTPQAPRDASCDLPAAARAAWERLDRTPGAALTVVVNDPQRGTATPRVLAALAATAGAGFRVLVACGSHRFDAAQRRGFEQRLAAAADVAEIAWHDATGDGIIDIGGLWRGHPWLGDGPLLGVGSVEPHYFAGFTGAHKTLTIGVAGRDDIERNHAAALSPLLRPARLERNPIHEGVVAMLRRLKAARRVAAVNLVQAGDRILAAAGGEPLAALQEASGPARATFVRSIPRRADALIAEVAAPLGRSFYQADKGIKNNEWAVRDRGALVLVADCDEGVGQADFLDALRRAPTYAESRRLVRRRGYRLGDHKAVRLRYLTDPSCRGVDVYVVASGLDADDAAVLGVTPAGSVEAALVAAGVAPSCADVYRVADAGNVCVTVGGD